MSYKSGTENCRQNRKSKLGKEFEHKKEDTVAKTEPQICSAFLGIQRKGKQVQFCKTNKAFFFLFLVIKLFILAHYYI